MTTSAEITKKFKDTSFGRVAYVEAGPPDRPPVLFVHGIPTSGYLWRHVLRLLRNDFRCYAPDLMGLGDTEVDPRRTPFHMEAQAEMLEELMVEGFGHQSFSVVCHDQGGAAAQLLAARRPGRLRCLVITDCVCYDNWPVPIISALQSFLRVPLLSDLAIRAGLFKVTESSRWLSVFKRCVYDPERMTAEAALEYLRPLHGGRAERERFRQFFLAGSPRYTMSAVEGLRAFDKPTLVVWAADDNQISPSWGRRLFEEIPGATRFELIPFCGHFWQEERPAEFAAYIGPFLAEHGGEAKERAGEE